MRAEEEEGKDPGPALCSARSPASCSEVRPEAHPGSHSRGPREPGQRTPRRPAFSLRD